MNKIPKVIHYCWFGRNPLPKEALRCMESWKQFCPDYEIKRWDEENFDVNACRFSRQAYENGKFAFVSDYARIKVIYEEGGIYLDTDVELLKSLDPLLEDSLYLGAEGTMHVATGLGFGATAGHPYLKDSLQIYENMDFSDESGNITARNCPYYNTEICKKYGGVFPVTEVQRTESMALYPNDYFNPYDWKRNKLKVTDHTFSIHNYAATWMTESQKRALIINAKLQKIENRFGGTARKLSEFFVWNSRKNGGAGVLHGIRNRFFGNSQ